MDARAAAAVGGRSGSVGVDAGRKQRGAGARRQVEVAPARLGWGQQSQQQRSEGGQQGPCLRQQQWWQQCRRGYGPLQQQPQGPLLLVLSLLVLVARAAPPGPPVGLCLCRPQPQQPAGVRGGGRVGRPLRLGRLFAACSTWWGGKGPWGPLRDARGAGAPARCAEQRPFNAP